MRMQPKNWNGGADHFLPESKMSAEGKARLASRTPKEVRDLAWLISHGRANGGPRVD